VASIDRSSHFEFGENWRDYAKLIDETRIVEAVKGLQKLFPEGIAGKRILDIGCGAGLHALAALKIHAREVIAFDIDENSVATTRSLLTFHMPKENWRADVASVFDLTPDKIGTFDIVYSWGVLHHTGDMWRAIETASRLVAPGGQFAIAIYAKTELAALWRIEKQIYSMAPRFVQTVMRFLYVMAFLSAKAATGVDPIAYVRNYKKNRGMNFSHDAHDWLGGYPYEEATASEVHNRIAAMGFKEVRSFRHPLALGLFGSRCHEFVFARITK
jgi:2-polyprenyl-3-methyl-5-hydroxy-6-metoxy-1,4-benzoquinol methylase